MCRHRFVIFRKVTRQSHSWLCSRPAGLAQSAPLYLAASVKCHNKASLFYLKECLGGGARVSGKQGRGVLIGTHRWECEEGYGEDRETGGDGLPNPCLGYLIPVANGGDCDLQGRRTAVSGGQAESLRKDTCQPQHSGLMIRETNLKPCLPG